MALTAVERRFPPVWQKHPHRSTAPRLARETWSLCTKFARTLRGRCDTANNRHSNPTHNVRVTKSREVLPACLRSGRSSRARRRVDIMIDCTHCARAVLGKPRAFHARETSAPFNWASLVQVNLSILLAQHLPPFVCPLPLLKTFFVELLQAQIHYVARMLGEDTVLKILGSFFFRFVVLEHFLAEFSEARVLVQYVHLIHLGPKRVLQLNCTFVDSPEPLEQEVGQERARDG
mmetsp:Transcript_12862/g.35535  ORF Transcript_12862/g.35535 Transcript_12862/m.35535 type:complete len:233 (-) Transcript_12862:993-1691(-)